MRERLPIEESLPEICERLGAARNLVVVAPPGAGKTTRVPVAIFERGLAGDGAIVMLQPRRVAARAATERIAAENGWRVGEEAGYHIRFEKRYGANTKIRVVTEGILTAQLLDDAFLEGVSVVILDEFHERSLNTDMAVALLREVQQTVRPDLKIVVMSATLDAEPVAKYLGDCAIVRTRGRMFDVEIEQRAAPVSREEPLEKHVARAVDDVLGRIDGDVLVFLPGMREIERARGAIRGNDVAVLPLHGSLSNEEQQRALRRADRRKVILATNIAETSLTIDGVRAVVDAGLVRQASFDADRGTDRLDTVRISKASAAQRAGRAGRQAPGMAIRLWSEGEQRFLEEFALPELQRVDLANTVLMLHAWGVKEPREFGWFEKPPEERLAAAESLLEMLGAIEGGAITEVGRRMARLPVHPRVARMLVEAAGTRLLDHTASVAAVISDERGGDDLLHVLAAPERLEPQTRQVKEQLLRIARGLPASGTAIRAVEDLLLLAFADRVARRRESDPLKGLMVGGVGVKLAPGVLTPALDAAPLMLVLDARHESRQAGAEATVRSALPLERGDLERLFKQHITREAEHTWDAKSEKVVARTVERYRDLVIEEDPHGRVDLAKAGAAMAAALGPRAREIFEKDEACAKLLARVALLREHMKEQAWPAFDDGQLRQLLSEACANKRSLAEVDLAEALRGALVYPLDRLLDQHAPESLEVPSGSRIKLEYAMGTKAPVLAVRLQEVFGWLETPRVAGGRVAVLMHLLGPNFRPVQVTDDLRSFWSRAYFEVRKDLRVRYPKHKWPEDPLTATPEAKGRRRF